MENTATYAVQVGQRLRRVRQQAGQSLQAVEVRSNGRWRTAAVGSYERGDRNISMAVLAELAGFYDVPVRALLSDEGRPRVERAGHLVLDLPAVNSLEGESPDQVLLKRWVQTVQQWRGDYAGRVLSLRGSDLSLLAMSLNRAEVTVMSMFQEWGVLHATSSLTVPGSS
ncbi:transcriptional regulator [Frankia sp. AvcI1]|uniref:transcriptional regulator n=1 Tax=Frankia sp. AvcI1 TaxID=573496 RepID=UPI002118DE47|nr:transcriptional regulator [Frankia sp. AvcI1]